MNTPFDHRALQVVLNICLRTGLPPTEVERRIHELAKGPA